VSRNKHDTVEAKLCHGILSRDASVSSHLTDWLTDWQTDKLTDRLTDWLTDWQTYRLIDWLTDLQIDWPTDRLTDWLTDWQTDWLTDWKTDWLTDWLTDWHSVEQNPSWEANSHSGSQGIPRPLWNPSVHYNVQFSSWQPKSVLLVFPSYNYTLFSATCPHLSLCMMFSYSHMHNRILFYLFRSPKSSVSIVTRLRTGRQVFSSLQVQYMRTYH